MNHGVHLGTVAGFKSVRVAGFKSEDLGRLRRNPHLMLQAMIRDTKGAPNQIVYWSRLANWKNQTLTPNPEVIYVMPFFETRDAGPVVLEMPPAGADVQSPASSWTRHRRH